MESGCSRRSPWYELLRRWWCDKLYKLSNKGKIYGEPRWKMHHSEGRLSYATFKLGLDLDKGGDKVASVRAQGGGGVSGLGTGPYGSELRLQWPSWDERQAAALLGLESDL
ncbi:uncharacterized protein A4U43_C01F19220 [Asparagus officinalis]|uniref:Uncharacterized protein n=1 Tax=Asparagus officinalis TaxID=4686 RepID=A0A5P1FSB1_ASPOF|nr:uncharacterized protein A4U43_C01F19220 [Asparagus officinalis]